MTQSFNELVEARAKKNYGRGWVSCPAESIRNDYLEDAKKALFLEYAQKHPRAIEELIMGGAGVVPKQVACNARDGAMSVSADIRLIAYKPEDHVKGEPLHCREIDDVRLDKEPLQEIPTQERFK